MLRPHRFSLLLLALGAGGVLVVATCGGTTVIDAGGDATTTTGGTGASAGATTSSSGAGAGGGAVGCPAQYVTISGSCDLLLQDCPAGSTCVVATGGDGPTTSCVLSGGTAVHGQPCYTTTDCADGFFCDGTRCNAYCCPTTNEPCIAWPCDVVLDDGNGAHAYKCTVEGTCALFYDECPGEWNCHISNSSIGITDCDQPAASQSAEGAPCQWVAQCGESQACYGTAPGQNVCRQLCALATWQSQVPGLGGCAPNRSCVDLGLTQFPGVGICLPP